MSNWPVDHDCCGRRQQRLRDVMEQHGWDVVVVNQPAHVQWLTGVRYPWIFQVGAALTPDSLTLVAPSRPLDAAATEIVTYEAKWHSTLRNDLRQACDERLLQTIGPLPARVAVEGSSAGLHLSLAAPLDAEPELLRLRRFKEPDELRWMKRAIEATRRMYQTARELIAPGVSELEVFNALQSAAVLELGEMLTGTGNDYQCASRGGPPRSDRQAAAGELYILDLGPAFRGYFADNARTIAVTDPTPEQLDARRLVVEVFSIVEATVRPGASARQLFETVQKHLDQAPLGVFNHHLGHGVGLFPHEAPHLNPNWDDTFEEGDVFTAEPGLYAPELSAGMRIENQYRVTADGVECLTPFPTDLRV
ncbi:MAG: aminopeptidase P family protein [Planctomycetales bacterium]|nr:aminopeptidase P family protein [Planctomycetales bacterium]